MDKQLRRIFQEQVITQCRFALRAQQDFARDYANHVLPREGFYGIENFLNAAANVSKALWGQKPHRRKDLRDSLEVDDASPLKTVLVRNHYQHFDERLEEWFDSPDRGWFIDSNYMTRSAIQPSIPQKSVMRNFDPESGDILFWGDTFNMFEITKELQRILDKAIQLTCTPPSWSSQPCG